VSDDFFRASIFSLRKEKTQRSELTQINSAIWKFSITTRYIDEVHRDSGCKSTGFTEFLDHRTRFQGRKD